MIMRSKMIGLAYRQHYTPEQAQRPNFWEADVAGVASGHVDDALHQLAALALDPNVERDLRYTFAVEMLVSRLQHELETLDAFMNGDSFNECPACETCGDRPALFCGKRCAADALGADADK